MGVSLEKLLFYYYIVQTNDTDLSHILQLIGTIKTYPNNVLIAFMQMRNNKEGISDFVQFLDNGTFDIRCEELAALKTDIYGPDLFDGKRDSVLYTKSKTSFISEMMEIHEKYKSSDLDKLYRSIAHMNYPQKMLDIGKDINYVVFTYTLGVASYSDNEIENLKQLYLKCPVKVIKTLYVLYTAGIPYSEFGSFLRMGFSRAEKYIDIITNNDEVDYNMFPVFYIRTHKSYEKYLMRSEQSSGGRK